MPPLSSNLLTSPPHTASEVNQRFEALVVNPFVLPFLNPSSVTASHSMRLSHERLPNLGVPQGDVICESSERPLAAFIRATNVPAFSPSSSFKEPFTERIPCLSDQR